MTAVISCSSYSVAGQRIAVKVAGDPVSGNNGLFFVYTDHLGSSSILTDLAGTAVAGSEAHYLPFGGYRGTAPTQTLTDRGYTGQKENLDLGLMYYNARYYLPGLGKFASADTLIPDPTNPQAFNRYAYVLNNPIRNSDPTGHMCYDHTAGADLIGTCVNEDGSTYSLLPPTPIWTGSFLNKPDWAQYYGHTKFSEEYSYNTDDGQHPGLDYGKFAQLFGGTWNRRTREWDFDGTYGTPERPLIPVYAGCYCQVSSTSTGSPYAPGRVNLTHEAYTDYLLIYGHLQDIQVTSGSVTPDTIIGYLDTTQRHLHLEIRRISDNHFVNPFPYLSKELQVELMSFHGAGSGTTYRLGYPSHPAYQEPGYYLR